MPRASRIDMRAVARAFSAIWLCMVFALANASCQQQQGYDGQRTAGGLRGVAVRNTFEDGCSGSAAAADRSRHAGGPMSAGGGDCYLVKDHDKCTGEQCVWCHNKWSPMPGSDGFCEWQAKVGELPSIVYDCKRVQPREAQQQEQGQGSHVSHSVQGAVGERGPQPPKAAAASSSGIQPPATAAAAAAGSTRAGGAWAVRVKAAAVAGVRAGSEGSECYKIKERSACTPVECVWCRNKWSPSESAQGVCVWEKKASELPDWSYSCDHVKPSQVAAAVV